MLFLFVLIKHDFQCGKCCTIRTLTSDYRAGAGHERRRLERKLVQLLRRNRKYIRRWAKWADRDRAPFGESEDGHKYSAG